MLICFSSLPTLGRDIRGAVIMTGLTFLHTDSILDLLDGSGAASNFLTAEGKCPTSESLFLTLLGGGRARAVAVGASGGM